MSLKVWTLSCLCCKYWSTVSPRYTTRQYHITFKAPSPDLYVVSAKECNPWNRVTILGLTFDRFWSEQLTLRMSQSPALIFRHITSKHSVITVWHIKYARTISILSSKGFFKENAKNLLHFDNDDIFLRRIELTDGWKRKWWMENRT